MITPAWTCHPRVRACFTTRAGGVSVEPYASLNLATQVGDDPQAVAENRRRLRAQLALPAEPHWIEQVHGTLAIRVPGAVHAICADASWTDQPGEVCAVMTADCVPVLFADDQGRCVAAAHAGWKGLLGGVLEAAISAMPVAPSELQAWIGPAIGESAYQVGAELRSAFVVRDPAAAECFRADDIGRFHCDLPALARQRLRAAGIERISGGQWCTASDPAAFFSFRRDGVCGRMAALIWLVPE